ncbi:MAG: uracil-DNA glycosylase [Pyramidobacter sp.]|uniref:uracil-DNA glycosylase n=1 Tax=Pyramidobacter sp. TaxID=1943581 RepID=UPI002A7FD060|nr:uracil-DNA glycosylase [Pyramidobacter sp.]MDY4031530.1 uracil-DNA glycosylase [Pyramidobacter sp.]
MSALSALHQRVCQCRNCPLGQADGVREDGSAFYHVPGEGPENARLMIVGEAPGAEEERTGRPFVGRSGRLLTEILAAAGLKREEIFITSVCKCRPPKNRTPLRTEIAACLPWLAAQFEAIRPRLVLAVGNVPSQTLLGVRTGINGLRGRFHQFAWNGRTMTLRPLFHPAYLLRNPRRVEGSPWDKMLRDLVEARDFLAGRG